MDPQPTQFRSRQKHRMCFSVGFLELIRDTFGCLPFLSPQALPQPELVWMAWALGKINPFSMTHHPPCSRRRTRPSGRLAEAPPVDAGHLPRQPHLRGLEGALGQLQHRGPVLQQLVGVPLQEEPPEVRLVALLPDSAQRTWKSSPITFWDPD